MASQQKRKKTEPEANSSRLQGITAFFKEFAALITAVTALVGALVGFLLLFSDKKGSLALFPTATPEMTCQTYTRGFVQIVVTANQGLQGIYIVQSDATLEQPHLLVLDDTNGKQAGMTIFAYDRQTSRFILKSIVDRYCYEVPQGKDNLIQPVPIPNGDTVPIKLSDGRVFQLRLLYKDNSIQSEFIEPQ